MSHLQLSKNKHNGCSLYLSNVLAEFRFSTSKDSKLHLVLGCKITLLQGRSPVIWQLKSTEERRSIHCLTKSGNQRVQYSTEERGSIHCLMISGLYLLTTEGMVCLTTKDDTPLPIGQASSQIVMYITYPTPSFNSIQYPIFLPFLAQTPREQNLNSRSHS